MVKLEGRVGRYTRGYLSHGPTPTTLLQASDALRGRGRRRGRGGSPCDCFGFDLGSIYRGYALCASGSPATSPQLSFQGPYFAIPLPPPRNTM